jgi:hypothetical protein
MLLTKETRNEITRLLDELIKLKGVAEMVDGPLIGGAFAFADKRFGDKVPEPLQTMIRETLHKIFIDKNLDTIGEDVISIIFELVKLLEKEQPGG